MAVMVSCQDEASVFRIVTNSFIRKATELKAHDAPFLSGFGFIRIRLISPRIESKKGFSGGTVSPIPAHTVSFVSRR